MKTCVFIGPSLTIEQAREQYDGVFLPPARQGDVYRAFKQHRPHAIGIVDGYFRQVPAVWHKEILWAMSQGVHVFGSASMGALRAAELAAFGMQGVGRIFEAYRDGVLAPYDDAFEDDDEVAVVHGPPETGYVAVSEAMVNIRVTLAAATETGVISAATRDALAGIAKRLFFPDRNYETLLSRAVEQSVPEKNIDALRSWLPEGKINQKRDDALAMLAAMQALEAKPKQVSFHFEHTTMWEEAMAQTPVSAARNQSEARLQDALLEELRLEAHTYEEARQAALLRMLALAESERLGLETEPAAVKDITRQFRLAAGLFDRQDIEYWLENHHLDESQFQRLMQEEALLQKLEALLGFSWQDYLIDHLRVNGYYARLLARAQDKQRYLETSGEPLNVDGLTGLRLATWYFKQQLARPLPENIEDYAARLNFSSIGKFHSALLKERLYLLQEKRQGVNNQQ